MEIKGLAGAVIFRLISNNFLPRLRLLIMTLTTLDNAGVAAEPRRSPSTARTGGPRDAPPVLSGLGEMNMLIRYTLPPHIPRARPCGIRTGSNV